MDVEISADDLIDQATQEVAEKNVPPPPAPRPTETEERQQATEEAPAAEEQIQQEQPAEEAAPAAEAAGQEASAEAAAPAEAPPEKPSQPAPEDEVQKAAQFGRELNELARSTPKARLRLLQSLKEGGRLNPAFDAELARLEREYDRRPAPQAEQAAPPPPPVKARKTREQVAAEVTSLRQQAKDNEADARLLEFYEQEASDIKARLDADDKRRNEDAQAREQERLQQHFISERAEAQREFPYAWQDKEVMASVNELIGDPALLKTPLKRIVRMVLAEQGKLKTAATPKPTQKVVRPKVTAAPRPAEKKEEPRDGEFSIELA